MNSELLKEYQAFHKKSLATPSIESSKKRSADKAGRSDGKGPNDQPKRPIRRRELPHQLLQQSKKQAQASSFNYKTPSIGRSKKKFSVLASIVDFMRKRYVNQSEAIRSSKQNLA